MISQAISIWPEDGLDPRDLVDADEYVRFHFKGIPAEYELGAIAVGGKLEEVRFTPWAADYARDSVDGLIVVFQRDATLPNELMPGTRVSVNTDDTLDMQYFQLPMLWKTFIVGVERQMLRRVVAIGFESPHVEWLYNSWLFVPFTAEERNHGQV